MLLHKFLEEVNENVFVQAYQKEQEAKVIPSV